MHSFSPKIGRSEHSWFSSQVWNAARVFLGLPLGLFVGMCFLVKADLAPSSFHRSSPTDGEPATSSLAMFSGFWSTLPAFLPAIGKTTDKPALSVVLA